MFSNHFAVSLLITLAPLVSLIAQGLNAQAKDRTLVLKKEETIAFMGDSITAGGVRKNGYVTLVMQALNKEGLNLSHIGAGKSGNKSNDMLKRLDAHVISKKPQWMTLSCGVNDVWHFKLKLGKRTFKGVPLKVQDLRGDLSPLEEVFCQRQIFRGVFRQGHFSGALQSPSEPEGRVSKAGPQFKYPVGTSQGDQLMEKAADQGAHNGEIQFFGSRLHFSQDRILLRSDAYQIVFNRPRGDVHVGHGNTL